MYRYIKSSSNFDSNYEEFKKIIDRIQDELGPEYKLLYRYYSGNPSNNDVVYRIEVEDPEGYKSAFETDIVDIDYDSTIRKIRNQLYDSKERELRYQ